MPLNVPSTVFPVDNGLHKKKKNSIISISPMTLMQPKKTSALNNMVVKLTSVGRRSSLRKKRLAIERELELELIGKSNDELEKRHKKQSNQYVLPYNATVRIFWDCLITIITICNTCWIPIQIGFYNNASDESAIYSVVIGVVFLIEVILNFMTSYIDDATKEEVWEPEAISLRYLRSWFILDIFYIIPIQILTHNDVEDKSMSLLHVIQFCKVARVFKITTSPFFQNLTSTILHHINPSFLSIVKLITMFLFTQHLMACLYWYICWQIDFSSDWSPPPSVYNDKKLPIKYSYALHWAFIVTTANDVGPLRFTESVFTCCMLFIGIAINATIIGSTANLQSNIDKRVVQKKAHLDSVSDFLRYKRVPAKIQQEIRDYYDHIWNSGYTFSDVKLFKDLPSRIKLQLMLELKRSFINTIPLFKACSTTGVLQIIQSLQPVTNMPGDIILREAEQGDYFFFIERGRVSVSVSISNNKVSSIEIRNLGEGCFFGEIALLSAGSKRTATVKATSYCDLQILSRNDFNAICAEFRQFKMAVERVAELREQTSSNIKKMKKIAASEQPIFSKEKIFAKLMKLISPKKNKVQAEPSTSTKKNSIFESVVDMKFLNNISHHNLSNKRKNKKKNLN